METIKWKDFIMQVITSKDNEQIKQIRKLKEKKYRDEQGLYMIEGVKTIRRSNCRKCSNSNNCYMWWLWKTGPHRTKPFIWGSKIQFNLCEWKSF